MYGSPRLLLKRLAYYDAGGLKWGYLFVSGKKIVSTEGEPPAEYELSEYVRDFDGTAVAVHGYSLLVSPSIEPFRVLEERARREILGVLSRDEIGRIILNSLQKFLAYGVTLPIVDDPYAEMAADLAIRNSLRIAIIDKDGTVRRRPRIPYFTLRNEKIYLDERGVGDTSQICPVSSVNEQCIMVDVRTSSSSIPCIISILASPSPLFNPYRILGLDDGYISKNSISDIAIYYFTEPFGNHVIPRSIGGFMRLGLIPDIVIEGGDVMIEGKLAVGFMPEDIKDIVLKTHRFLYNPPTL